MRKVILTMKEHFKYQIIKKLVDHNGNKKKAALQLNCTLRTINRLILRYKSDGKSGFIHKNRGALPSNKIPLDLKENIIDFYQQHYLDTNFVHFAEIIKEEFAVTLSDSTLHNWLKQRYILSPKAHRSTKKKMKKHVKQLEKDTHSKKEAIYIKQLSHTIDERDAHPRRPRCKYAGEMIQMDASSFEWLPAVIWHLHVAIDDATGAIVGAFFDHQETLHGYYHVFQQILSNYGIPHMFYTDRRTVFEYKRKNTLLDDDDTFTQFAYACQHFGVEIKTTSVPQAKGRVERLNQTLQSRLPVELRRSRIQSIEQANAFLSTYLTKFNDIFSIPLDSSKSVYDMQPSGKEINLNLAVLSTRVIDQAHCVQFKKHYYLPINAYHKRQYFKYKTPCLVIEALDGKKYVSIDEKIYALELINDYETYSKNFDIVAPPQEKQKRIYIPPMSHPWKEKSFQQFKRRQQHRV